MDYVCVGEPVVLREEVRNRSAVSCKGVCLCVVDKSNHRIYLKNAKRLI